MWIANVPNCSILCAAKEELANLRRIIRANNLILFGVPDNTNTNKNLRVSVIMLIQTFIAYLDPRDIDDIYRLKKTQKINRC